MEWETVFSSREEVEAALIRGLLEGAGIRVVTMLKGMKGLSPIFGMRAPGEIELKVAPEAADLARAIIAAQPEPEADPEADPGADPGAEADPGKPASE